MKKPMKFLRSPINVLMIALVAGMFVGSIPAYAGSAASSAIMQYEKGMISEAELEQRLKDIGYSVDEIRQVKALTGEPDYKVDHTPSKSTTINTEENPSLKKTSNVSANEADNIMLVMGIAGASVVAAIVVAFVKRPL
jgi:hypothetical protein